MHGYNRIRFQIEMQTNLWQIQDTRKWNKGLMYIAMKKSENTRQQRDCLYGDEILSHYHASQGHLQPYYWLCRLTRSLSFLGEEFNYMRPLHAQSWLTKHGCFIVRWTLITMTSSNGSIFRVTGHLCGEFTGHRWIPHTKANDAEL